ncbi:hypothetical protein FNV43_RR03962 [Rhamnella rubrinervis]|uniref:Fe2OG dioxygenase domain-containing protein n=1 Tax=Rhamnella rubrinervis TaxID=2594499 RepID=A0A8K0HIX2_9ROSA|nr:hypothetical protein FNV43_RR03962 [Rhamnella rubrinervis]
MDFEPPFQVSYKTLLKKATKSDNEIFLVEEYCELPLINLSRLSSGQQLERERCMNEIADAASRLGFFQIINHGIPKEVLRSISYEQKNVFHQPFQKKVKDNFLNLSANSYRWGNPKATCLRQFSWSEAFHISITEIPRMTTEYKSLRLAIEKFAKAVASIAKILAEILSTKLGIRSCSYFQDNCPAGSSYVRLNRYPPCPYSSKVYGLIPHTDSDFLTLVYQDMVGGLQLFNHGAWFSVKPNPDALIVNIGDLFQAMSNCVYRSTKHRVVGNTQTERFSVAYFYCPSNDAIIQSFTKPAVYRNFTFSEYKLQNQTDVQENGDKIGLSKFLL